MKKDQKLSRIDIMALVLGAIIGWGSFTLPGSKFLPQSGVVNTMLGFLLGGVLVSFVVIGYRTLMQNNHEDGGEFSYTLHNLGQGHGFVVGWALALCYLSLVPLNATAAALILLPLADLIRKLRKRLICWLITEQSAISVLSWVRPFLSC